MIPKIPESGCPLGTFKGIDTCFCEDHCSWEICRLINPPYGCLSRIGVEVYWLWDNNEDAWAAQRGNVALSNFHNFRQLANMLNWKLWSYMRYNFSLQHLLWMQVVTIHLMRKAKQSIPQTIQENIQKESIALGI